MIEFAFIPSGATEMVDSVTNAMCSVGIKLINSGNFEQDFGDYAGLLVLGQDNWATPDTERKLAVAKKHNIPTFLWQFEPLLPPDLPDDASKTRDRLISLIPFGQKVELGRISKIKFWTVGTRLAAQCRNVPAISGVKDAHPFWYPGRQTRNILYLVQSGLIDHVFVSLKPRQRLLAEYSIPSYFIPVGSVESHGQLSKPNRIRDIDVLFLGNLSSRRRARLKALGRRLHKENFSLKIVTGDCFGTARSDLVNRCKILVNLHKFPWEFPGLRLSIAMRCGAVVVSEWAPDIAPFDTDNLVLAAPGEDIANPVLRLLNDDKKRQAMAAGAHQFAISELTPEKVMSRAIHENPQLKKVLGIG